MRKRPVWHRPVPDRFLSDAEVARRVAAVTAEARAWVAAHTDAPAGLLDDIERQGIPVLRLSTPWAQLAAWVLLGLKAGFNPPRASWRSGWLIRWAGPGVREHGVWAVARSHQTLDFLTHQVHRWLAFRAGLPGTDEPARLLAEQFWQQDRGQVRDSLSVEELRLLKEAIRRDREAWTFLQEMLTEVFLPKGQGPQLTQQGDAWV